MGLRAEIFQQPQVVENLLKEQWPLIQDIAQALKDTNFQQIFLAARGTSDNAGLYAKYLLGIHNRLPIALAAPSLFSIYQRPPNIQNSLVLGISQSGMSPDIISVLDSGRKQGAPSLVITNDPESPMAQMADYVIDILAGQEFAVAATKTYTAQLVCIALLSAGLAEDGEKYAALKRLPAYIEAVLNLDSVIKSIAERYFYMQHCVVLGRGYNYATAFEWSLKLKELSYVVAQPYSSADFLHGPIAIIEQGFPVMVVIPEGVVFNELLGVVRRLREQHHANMLILSNLDEALSFSDHTIRLPKMPEWLSPIVSIIPAQLFCYWLSKLKGYDTESPKGLTKITETI